MGDYFFRKIHIRKVFHGTNFPPNEKPRSFSKSEKFSLGANSANKSFLRCALLSSILSLTRKAHVHIRERNFAFPSSSRSSSSVASSQWVESLSVRWKFPKLIRETLTHGSLKCIQAANNDDGEGVASKLCIIIILQSAASRAQRASRDRVTIRPD